MEVTLSEIVMLVKLSQYANAKSPIEVTLSGIVMLVKLLKYANAQSPIEETPYGIIKSFTRASFKYNFSA